MSAKALASVGSAAPAAVSGGDGMDVDQDGGLPPAVVQTLQQTFQQLSAARKNRDKSTPELASKDDIIAMNEVLSLTYVINQ